MAETIEKLKPLIRLLVEQHRHAVKAALDDEHYNRGHGEGTPLADALEEVGVNPWDL